MRCKKCDTENKESVSFCKKCGTSLIPDNICKKCGIENDLDATFCEKCGEKLKPRKQEISEQLGKLSSAAKSTATAAVEKIQEVAEQAEISPKAISEQVKSPRKKINVKVLRMGLVAAFLLIIGGLVLFFTNKAGNTVTLNVVGNPSEGMLIIQQGRKYGFADIRGNVAVPCVYDEVEPFSNGIAKVRYGNDWAELQNPDGSSDFTGPLPELTLLDEKDLSEALVREKLEAKYDYCSNRPDDNLWDISKGEKYGLADENGTEIVPCKYESIGYFTEGYAVVKSEGKYGFINTAGVEVIPCIYNDVRGFSEGLAGVVNTDDTLGFIDTAGKTVVPFAYDPVSEHDDGSKFYKYGSFHEGIALVGDSTGVAAVDITGKELNILPDGYSVNLWSNYFSEGLSSIEINGEPSYIDRSGQIVISCDFDYTGPFQNGVALVGTDTGEDAPRRFGLIDKNGLQIIPCQYEEIRYFSDNLIGVKSNGLWVFIDHQMNRIGTNIYQDIGAAFVGDVLLVTRESGSSLLDKSGNETIPAIFSIDSFGGEDNSINVNWGGQMYSLSNGQTNPTSPSGLSLVFQDGSAKQYKSFAAGVTSYLKSDLEGAQNALSSLQNFRYPVSYLARTYIEQGNTDQAEQLLFGKYGAAEINNNACNQVRSELLALNYDKYYQKATELAQSEDYDSATAILLGLLQNNPEKEELYLDLANIALIKEKVGTAQELLELGYAATKSEKIKAMLLNVNLENDFGGETGQILSEGLKIAEKIAGVTGDSEKLELGKDLYMYLRQFQ